MRLFVQHRSHYEYPRPAALGPHLIRLRPANHTRARVETYRLAIEPAHRLHWTQDPHGNHVARVTFQLGQRIEYLEVVVELAVDIQPVNPFDFLVDPRCKTVPFAYPDGLAAELAPFLGLDDPAFALGARAREFIASLPTTGDSVELVVEANRRVAQDVRYVIREEAGVWTPEETLCNGRGSCRDSAVLLVAALRSRGLAARFVSGYLIQLTDEGMIPDQPKGVGRDVVDLHAWAEVYLPGGGWIGLDATSGLLTGEGHIPLACTASPAHAAPIEGTSDTAAVRVDFATSIARLGHEPRPTAPYTEKVWQELLAGADRADLVFDRGDLVVTVGGEPTFTSREAPEAPEWNGEALGDSKWRQGVRLADALRERMVPGAAVLHRMGKHYPGESMPRWALELCARRDGEALWPTRRLRADASIDAAERLGNELARRLGVPAELHPAFEDPWRLVQDEAALPVGIDPRRAGLDDPEERRRLARTLDRGVGAAVGVVLPLARIVDGWATERWQLRREHLFLVPGDSPIGLRLPLASLGPGFVPQPIADEAEQVFDPRRLTPSKDRALEQLRVDASDAQREMIGPRALPQGAPRLLSGVRTALCIEPRDGRLWAFLPPVPRFADWIELLAALDQARVETGLDVALEGYPPPSDPNLLRFAVTPDPGVLEVNVPPSASGRDHAALLDTVHEAALASGLSAEKYLLDGRLAGPGGGHHITVGGPAPLQSPWLRRPELLASLITFCQHHPSLSYLFTGLFVGPTSQAPRVDEARHDALAELEIALDRAYASGEKDTPPWLVDALFRNLLVDVAGSTHRAEISLDKLFDPQTPFGRQGLVELRAFEMPPHPRMAAAQVILVRALVAAFAQAPYRGPLVRWGHALHDRFLLPYHLERDLADVLAFLDRRDLALPADGYTPFVELRCPLVGTLDAGDVTLELRNALEPWPVLGEELTASGTSRYVDSSLERVEVRARGLVPERHRVLVNGVIVPLQPTAEANVQVAGVRFRAWCAPHSLHPHLGVHHPLRFEVIDLWGERSLGACAYHVWHPEGRAFAAPPLTRFEASARRAQRFTREGPTPWPVQPREPRPHPDQPHTLDLRRTDLDRPLPRPWEWPGPFGEAPDV
jgi:uncharacterized protein (DUF2126 family)/transglutaminase-like putative cysteine protease